MAPNPDTPLVGVLELSTDEPTIVRISLSNVSQTRVKEFDKFNTDHSLPVLGFHPGKTHTISVVVIDKAGNETTAENDLEVTTEPLPEGFPPIEVLVSKPEKMEPGATLLTPNGRGGNSSFGSSIVIVNSIGEVIWYHKPDAGVGDTRRLANGNLLFISGPSKITEMGMLGNVVQEWHTTAIMGNEGSIPLDIRRFHHEVFKMESGNFLVLSDEEQLIDNYPTSETDPLAPTETAFVTGDVMVEFSRDGRIINEWLLLDILDPIRIGYQSLNVLGRTEGKDWSHANAVIHDPQDDSIIVSVRHQDAVIKYSRSTGELIWILGPHENWDPDEFGKFLLTPTNEGEFFWPYHAHAPMITLGGCILLYDNGNFRASPFDEKLPVVENFSRAAEYCIDEDSNEITLIWEYGQFAEEIIYTPFIGDADFLPETENVLITFGGITKDEEGNPSDGVRGSKISVRIIEVTHTTPAEKVFELSIVDNTPDISNGWISYRAERVPSLYR